MPIERPRGRHLFFIAALAAALAVAGCVSSSEPRPLGPDVPPPPQFVDLVHKCSATQSRFALGQKVTPEVLEEARNRTGARSAVAVRAGGAMPSPADPLRLVLEVDGEGRMTGARCS